MANNHEPCLTPVGTCAGTTLLGSTSVASGRDDATAGWSLRDTSWEILTWGCRSQGGNHSIISDGKKLAQK